MAKRIRSTMSSKETEDVAAALAIDAEAASASGRPVRAKPVAAAATAAAKGKSKPAGRTIWARSYDPWSSTRDSG